MDASGLDSSIVYILLDMWNYVGYGIFTLAYKVIYITPSANNINIRN